MTSRNGEKTHRRQNMGSIQGFLCATIQGSAHGTEDVTGRGVRTIIPRRWASKCGNTHYNADDPDSSVSQPLPGNSSRPPRSHHIKDYECDVDSAAANSNRNQRNATNVHQQMQVCHTTNAPATNNTIANASIWTRNANACPWTRPATATHMGI